MLGILISRVHLASVLLYTRRRAIVWLVAAVVVWFICIVLSAPLSHRLLFAGDLSSRCGRLPRSEWWGCFTGDIHLCQEDVGQRPGLAFEVLTPSLAYQLAVMLAAFLAAAALGLDLGWTSILALMPAVAIV